MTSPPFTGFQAHSLQGRPTVCSTVVLLDVVVGSELRGSAGEGLTAECRAVQVEGGQESCREGHGGNLGPSLLLSSHPGGPFLIYSMVRK